MPQRRQKRNSSEADLETEGSYHDNSVKKVRSDHHDQSGRTGSSERRKSTRQGERKQAEHRKNANVRKERSNEKKIAREEFSGLGEDDLATCRYFAKHSDSNLSDKSRNLTKKNSLKRNNQESRRSDLDSKSKKLSEKNTEKFKNSRDTNNKLTGKQNNKNSNNKHQLLTSGVEDSQRQPALKQDKDRKNVKTVSKRGSDHVTTASSVKQTDCNLPKTASTEKKDRILPKRIAPKQKAHRVRSDTQEKKKSMCIKTETSDQSTTVTMATSAKLSSKLKNKKSTNSSTHNNDKITNKRESVKNVTCADKITKTRKSEMCVSLEKSADVKGESDDNSSSESESDWEEVKDLPEERQNYEDTLKSQLPSEPVQVTLDAPDFSRKKKRKQFDMEAWFRRQMNRYKRDLRVDMHKVHLLCLLAHGFHVNGLCMKPLLQAVALSQTSDLYAELSPAHCGLNHLKKLLEWFKDRFTLNLNLLDEVVSSSKQVQAYMKKLRCRTASTVKDFVVMLVLILRAIGFDTRIVFSFQPISLKEKVAKKKPDKNREGNHRSKSGNTSSETGKKKCHDPAASTCKTSSKVQGQGQKSECEPSPHSSQKNKETSAKRTLRVKNDMRRKSASKISAEKLSSLTDSSCESDGDDSDDSDYTESGQGKKKVRKKTAASQKQSQKKKSCVTESSKSATLDDDFEEERKFRSPIQNRQTKNKQTILSSEDSNDSVQCVSCTDTWLEVYLPVEQRWICIDCKNNMIDDSSAIEKEATPPICYVLAYDNANKVKDVTRRYASNWMSNTRKLRVDADWWEETLKPFRSYYTEREQLEDSSLQVKLIRKPLPTTVGEYKNHPLYALTRHLLKFEAIYPSTAVPLGYIKKEPVYARECVRTLHNKDGWTKEGRAIRIGEVPYKIVKGRAKRNKPLDGSTPTLELFGEWQTEMYMAPPAFNGKVPRNEYGNVELFQPWMLPAGAVHLQIAGLNKVAKKLDIDCVPAMVGWDFHSGYNHPVFDGFVVCEEHKDILLAAWDEESEIQKEKEAEKREKRVLNNWKVLIKGLLVKDRLEKRYDLYREEGAGEDSASGSGVEQKAADLPCSWPQNLQLKTKPSNPASEELFPFEKM